jgi:hypothetical protein
VCPHYYYILCYKYATTYFKEKDTDEDILKLAASLSMPFALITVSTFVKGYLGFHHSEVFTTGIQTK